MHIAPLYPINSKVWMSPEKHRSTDILLYAQGRPACKFFPFFFGGVMKTKNE